ncbi:hypothetical protein [Glycomyces harbinensis]|uniref:SH3 domain-containing protein n=1 Tax=Glycomyces harbinensis TaxID=58114 RepID=A0A1G7BPZ8_9ACTN|nr:hypothetical protein [Glycomyces harbinensis]SDE29184.1 hypothetical protein SAMN05216270_11794 [Glycomyces harbinensis]
MIKFTKGVIMVLKKLFTAIGVTAAAFALSLTASTSATAAPIEAPTPVKSRIENTAAPDTAAEPRTCRARFTDGLNHRLRAEAGSQILGIIPAGTWVQASCERVDGGEYDACGVASAYWLEIYWNGNWGHGAWGCLQDWEFTS